MLRKNKTALTGSMVTSDYEYAATSIEKFIAGTGAPYDWDDYSSIRESDPYLENVRIRCLTVPDQFPSKEKTSYCSEEGIEVLRSIAAEVRLKLHEKLNEAEK